MVSLDFEWLDGLGLGALSEEDKRSLLRSVYEELETRVGARLAEGMTLEQLLEFEAFMDAGDQQGAKQWLDDNAPDYKKIPPVVLDEIGEELRSRSDELLQDRRG